jgi:hypothetical protein
VLTFCVPSQNVDSPVRYFLHPSVVLSLYMPVTNSVLAKTVEPPRSLALYLPRYVVTTGVRGGAVRSSRVLFPMVSLEFFIDNPSSRTMTQPLTEMSISNICWGIKAADAEG